MEYFTYLCGIIKIKSMKKITTIKGALEFIKDRLVTEGEGFICNEIENLFIKGLTD